MTSSFRIGAKINLFPTKVYLHAGTRRGARALGLDDRAKHQIIRHASMLNFTT